MQVGYYEGQVAAESDEADHAWTEYDEIHKESQSVVGTDQSDAGHMVQLTT